MPIDRMTGGYYTGNLYNSRAMQQVTSGIGLSTLPIEMQIAFSK